MSCKPTYKGVRYNSLEELKSSVINSQQKQQAQSKFQEYINATGKQDIEGFKNFVTQPSTSVEEGIKIPAYTIDINLTNANGTKRLASTSGGIIKLNPVKSVQEFFNYFEGNEVGPSSAQKKMVLVEMEKQGYPLKKIKSILNTTKLVNTFLVLHEQDHIDQNDVDVYWKMSKSDLLTPDKLLIETRASINALKKIESTQPSTSVKEGVEDNKDISQEPENPFCGPNQ